MDVESNAREVRIYRKASMWFLALCVAGSVVGAIVCAAFGLFALAVAVLCFAGFCAIGRRAWAIMPTAVAWGTYDSAGTTIRIDKRVERLLMLALCSFTAGVVVFVIACSLDRLGIPFPTGFARIYILFLVSCVGLASLAPMVVTLRRPGLSTVRLGPDSFEIAEGFSTQRGSWEEVTDVTNDAPAYMRTVCPVSFEAMTGAAPKILRNATLFAPNGEILLEYVRYYWQTPQARGELTDGRGLDRLLSMQRYATQSEPDSSNNL